MTQDQLDKLEKATTLVFEVEQEWRKNPRKKFAVESLYAARVQLNNAKSRG
jgi:hypothetical protein